MSAEYTPARRAYLHAWKIPKRAIAQAFLRVVNAKTFCVHCGAQPVEWHNPDHVELNRRGYQLGRMAANGVSVKGIQAEMARCTPLCRRCHMVEDGRMAAFRDQAKTARAISLPKPCTQCERLFKPLRRGLCGKCAGRVYYQTSEKHLKALEKSRLAGLS